MIAPFTFAPHAARIEPSQRKQIRDTAERHGLQIVGLHWLLAQTTGFHLTHPDAEVRHRTADYFRELIDLCGDLGRAGHGGSVRQSIPPRAACCRASRPGRGWTSREKSSRRACPRRKREAWCWRWSRSARRDDLYSDDRRGDRAGEAIDHPSFRINLDVKAMADEATGIPEIVRSAAPFLEHVQVNDRTCWGRGWAT